MGEGEEGKGLREYVTTARESMSESWAKIRASVEAPVKKAEEVAEVGSAHFDASIKNLVALRHNVNPAVSMSLAALVIALPAWRVMGVGSALRYGTVAFCATGLFVYPDFVNQQVTEWSTNNSDS